MVPGSARNALGRRSDGQWRTFRYRRDRLIEPVQMAPFPAVGAIMKARNLSRKGVDSRGMAAGSHGFTIEVNYDIPLKLLPGSVKVPKQIFGRSAAVKVTFTLPKHFYGAPKNDAQGP